MEFSWQISFKISLSNFNLSRVNQVWQELLNFRPWSFYRTLLGFRSSLFFWRWDKVLHGLTFCVCNYVSNRMLFTHVWPLPSFQDNRLMDYCSEQFRKDCPNRLVLRLYFSNPCHSRFECDSPSNILPEEKIAAWCLEGCFMITRISGNKILL